MDAPRRFVVYLDIHAGDAPAAPAPAGGAAGPHPAVGELVELLGRDGRGCYEVERVNHDFAGGRHVVRVFVEQAGPFPACAARVGESQASGRRAAPVSGSPAPARLVV